MQWLCSAFFRPALLPRSFLVTFITTHAVTSNVPAATRYSDVLRLSGGCTVPGCQMAGLWCAAVQASRQAGRLAVGSQALFSLPTHHCMCSGTRFFLDICSKITAAGMPSDAVVASKGFSFDPGLSPRSLLSVCDASYGSTYICH